MEYLRNIVMKMCSFIRNNLTIYFLYKKGLNPKGFIDPKGSKP